MIEFNHERRRALDVERPAIHCPRTPAQWIGAGNRSAGPKRRKRTGDDGSSVWQGERYLRRAIAASRTKAEAILHCFRAANGNGSSRHSLGTVGESGHNVLMLLGDFAARSSSSTVMENTHEGVKRPHVNAPSHHLSILPEPLDQAV